VVDLESGTLLGFEALARWCSNGIPILAPIEWLPFAEESGLVVEVDRAMLRSSVAQLAAWRKDAPDSELELAINLSGRTLQQDGIDDEVIQALNFHGVPAHRLVVEVTEGVLINDARVGDRLRRLRTNGVRIALDDFGTGWASLSYLRHLPVDHLKLDQSFTADLGRQPEADAIPSAIAHLARGLSLGLVAEGVETVDQRQRLLTLGFRVGQGYLFGRAQPPSDLRNHVLNSRPLLEITIDENPAR
jgi:EAL domain-containing protein (putative c-di-GMP-specific phosphodiesterase class I)